MNKNGFIATSLIYSFFLVFCAVLLSYISISAHNKNLLKNANDKIRFDIQNKTINNIEVGSSIKLNLSNSSYNLKNITWELFYNQEGTAEFISSSIILSNKDINYINYYLSTLKNDCMIDKARVITKQDIYNKIKDNIKDVLILKNLLNTTDILGNNVGIGNTISYLIKEGNDYKKYNYLSLGNDNISLSEFTNSNLTNSNIISINENENINVRAVITLPTNIGIIGGNGSKGNPYILNTNTCFEDNTLVNKVLSNGYDNVNNVTTPGVEASRLNEGLRSTEDDYGISYYFRGDVKDNYVQFARKCWQIVRINGDGSIKLILKNHESSDCNVDANKGYIYSSNTKLNSKFNTLSDDNTYIGYKYGQKNSTTYDLTHANQNDSTILGKLQNWYENEFTNDEKIQLVDTIWCNDKLVDSTTGTGIGTNNVNYMAYNRVNNSEQFSPSLKCSNTLSKFTINDTSRGNGSLNSSSKVGLLTADEVLFAGLVSNSKNDHASSYLLDSTSTPWWTLTPAEYNNGAKVFAVNGIGKLVSVNVSEELNIKPVIVIKSDIYATGTGKINDPYSIE